ncbi:hypothetical protein [Tenacibaculum caenipelagi]|uniref:Uncharacterized protein n=1 Tax=Tenacibaculum caenipelagi TaxID=1325435 RepID=A0A4R6TG85_9FLAO|nr:hypothetical protein [Tenacibaculum caenipelagi]TDQ27746.1 hypothetical protein DFQ07_1599 [Tenacibaculum caenipelagi]
MKKYLCCFAAIFFSCYTIFSQQEKESLIWFDKIIQPYNLEINSGTKYFEKYRTSDNNHHFLLDNKFNSASILYKNNWYHNILTKYDILEENLIIIINSAKQETSIKPDYNHISAFNINDRFFLKLNHNNAKGYYEKIATINNLTLYKKNYLKKVKRIKKSSTFFIFKKRENFFLSKKNALLPLNKKSEWIEAFPNQKKTITSFFNQNKNAKLKNKFCIDLLKKLTR